MLDVITGYPPYYDIPYNGDLDQVKLTLFKSTSICGNRSSECWVLYNLPLKGILMESTMMDVVTNEIDVEKDEALKYGNKENENFIKEFQFNSTEYEKVIEWIPFDKLINLQEINEESDLVFIATWVKGVRIIKDDHGKYMQSRTISSVDLMKLNCSQTDTLELFENVS
ncbi:hypothetical protein C2G38_2181135 [Gigaspora rosea]|uniref:Uncharacterized protein n=1 Tax=Gigaspora rosea TaxID=44941 RepID=A0A397VFG4_9GLOM|nr:hypothetical protein C2G38_2181135 [Gigaspora rosea]